ncbi:hypothetical protein VCHC50A2_1887B, partial [Vibrio cholerae HC-50A2]
ALSSP